MLAISSGWPSRASRYFFSVSAIPAATSPSPRVRNSPSGIRVNCICPGTVHTPMPEAMFRTRGDGDVAAGVALTEKKYLLARLGQPEEIASTALFLAGPDGSFFTGAVLAADGGVTAQ